MNYCKSVYALYFYGNPNLANQNTYSQSLETMYISCVTILGVDSNKIFNYTINIIVVKCIMTILNYLLSYLLLDVHIILK